MATIVWLPLAFAQPQPGWAQEKPAAAQPSATAQPSAAAEQQPEPLSDEEMQVLVARIALYPDDLVAVISQASLFPLQIVEANRFLDALAKDKSLKPKDSWDGSVVSLLNYPQIVKMMSDDLDWTQAFGNALSYQQKDVLVAIQQLRDDAVAAGVIKSDDKIKVVQQSGNVVIQPASSDSIYVPQYEPEMLYEPGYTMAPISYYPEPYPYYYYPTAPFFAGVVTGAIWAAAIDWDDGDIWGGGWDGDDINIDCNKCFNDINGKINFNDVDWKNIDRSKINFDKNQFANIDRTNLTNRIKADNGNKLSNRAADIRQGRADQIASRPGKVSDVRKNAVSDMKAKAPAARNQANRPAAKQGNISKPSSGKKANAQRPSGKPKPAARADNRPKKPSGLGEVKSGKRESVNSRRGGSAMGGGHYGGSRPQKAVNRGGRGGHGGGGGGRGGGGRGGGGGRR